MADQTVCSFGRVIAATRTDAAFLQAADSSAKVIFDLDVDVLTLSGKIKHAHAKEKKLFVHIDLASGIGKDASGIALLKRMGVDGVISTKVNMIKLAREAGLVTVQRFFAVDSQSLRTTVESVRTSRPDMIEIMPGTVCKVIGTLGGELATPIIAGGLIETPDEIEAAISSGAAAVSTGKIELWEMKI
jgi:glycerol uptake operon antiterminator